MVWGEHCIECADPGCYASCDLYQRRPDGRCRRFAYGIYRNRWFPSLRGYGAEIAFKRWGKLEADGNTHLEDVQCVLRRERAMGRSGAILRTLAAAAFLVTGRPHWKPPPPDPRKLARRLHLRGASSSGNASSEGPSSFLLEIYNPASHPVTLHLTMRVVPSPGDRPEQLPPPFLARLPLPVGYSCHRIDRERFRHILDCGRRFKVTLMPEGDAAVTLIFLTADFVAEARHADPVGDAAAVTIVTTPEGQSGRPVKCVVFDLDHTVWEGTLLEGGVVSPREDMVRLIHELDKRGILISIASKNDFGSAWQRLENLNLAEYFVWPEINWLPKSENIRKIASRLNIGLDTFAFVDDSPFELAEVGQALPMVTCLNANAIGGILDQTRFRGSTSADARARRAYYKDAIEREHHRAGWSGSYVDFLRSCDMKLTVRPYQAGDFERVAELVQRTNQLNFSGCGHSRSDFAKHLENARLSKYVLACRDRYGTYGTIGFALVSSRPAELRIEELMVSCRVQGRFIEQAFFWFLVREVAEETPSRLWVRFKATECNGPARYALERMNFQDDPAGGGFVLNIAEHTPFCDVVEVIGSGSNAVDSRAGGSG